MTESEQLAERLVSCLPAATFEMEALCRLAGIEASRDVATAAVSCEGRPRLLVNPDFVAEHCSADEHLFLLVMHELWHVLLAHTRLYPRPDRAHNIAFDAIINAGLARQHPELAYRGFFEPLNPADEFPGLLLRPPVGWPERPAYPDNLGPKGTRGLLKRLYPPLDDWRPEPLYEELLAVLGRHELTDADEVTLLGDHDHPDTDGSDGERNDRRALEDHLVGDVIRRIVAKWPPPPFPLGGRDDGGTLGSWAAVAGPVTDDTRRAFARVLRRALGPHPGGHRRRVRARVATVAGPGVLPNPRDRLAPARRALGGPETLWAQPGTVNARVPDQPARALVYLDVSGSMQTLLPHLVGLLLPYANGGEAEVSQFSTAVRPLSARELARGDLQTTGGTSIHCVLSHLLDRPRVRRVLLLTDGYTGSPAPQHLQQIRDRHVRVHVVLPQESAWAQDLRELATSITVLPPLGGTPTRRL